MSSLKNILWLSMRKTISNNRIFSLIADNGSADILYGMGEYELSKISELTDTQKIELADKSMTQVEKILTDCQNKQIQIITYEDSIYPTSLAHIYDPPLVLYVRGKMPIFDDEIVISVVGTRKCTPYGKNAALRICEEIASGGGLVVSGMARGIDTAAHIGALNAGKQTVAIFGNGVDICYPAENKELMDKIISNGAVISEFPPGTPSEAKNFPIRNRLISALAKGVLIVEAPLKSGALITAERAAEQGKDIFAVPGNIDSETSKGTNQLIRDGVMLVTSGKEVLSEYEWLMPHKIVLDKIKIKDTVDVFTKSTIKIYHYDEKIIKYSGEERLILEVLKDGAMHIDKIINETRLTPQAAAAAITLMEIKKLVSPKPGKYYEIGSNF